MTKVKSVGQTLAMGRTSLATLTRNKAENLEAYLSGFLDHLNVEISPHLPPIVFECKIFIKFIPAGLKHELRLHLWNIDGCWKEFNEKDGYTRFDCLIIFDICEEALRDSPKFNKKIKEQCEHNIEDYMVTKLKDNRLIYIKEKNAGLTNIHPLE